MKLYDFVKANVDSINNFEQQEFNWACRMDGSPLVIIERVKSQNGEVAAVMDTIPECLSRNAVAECMKEDLYKGFVAAVLWGGMHKYMVTQRHFQTAVEQSPATVVEKLKRVKSLIDKSKLEEAYTSMTGGGENHIKGLGSSYFTKVMYFLGYGSKAKVRPFIYDNFLKFSHFALMFGRNENPFYFYVPVDDDLLYAESTNPAEVYSHYCKTLTETAKELGIESPDNLEAWLFSGRTEDGDNPRMAARDDVKSLAGSGFIHANLRAKDQRDAFDLSRIFYCNGIELLKEYQDGTLDKIGRDAEHALVINETGDYVHLVRVAADLVLDLQKVEAEMERQQLISRGERQIDRLDFIIKGGKNASERYSLYFDITAGYAAKENH